MAKNFATLNPNALGPALALDLGNLVVTTNQIGVDGNRMVLSTIPKAVGYVWINAYFYSNSQSDLTALCSLGLAQTDCPLDEYVGGPSGKSWGLRPAEGGIWHAGVDIGADSSGASTPTIAERRCLGVYVNFQGETSAGPFAAWYLEGSQIGSVILPSGKFWCLAVGVGTTDQGAGDVSAFVNFGQRPFDFQPNRVIV